MKLSIVLSTYNGEQYIIEQLESIRNQSRQADEVLIFDDCSNDHTVEIVSIYIQNNELSNWKIVVNSKNKGWKKNFMNGLWAATGDLIFPCDQDDIWMPDKLRIMEKIMSENPEIQVLTSNYEEFGDSVKVKGEEKSEDNELVKQSVSQNLFNTKYPGCTYCIRREYVDLSKNYWEDDYPHDALFWRMGMFSDTLYSYHKSLIRWRKHQDSAYSVESICIKSMHKKRMWFDYALRTIDSLEDFVEDHDVKDRSEKEKLFAFTRRWIQIRIEFYDTGKISYWLRLFKYRNCYDRFKQYIGDFYLVKMKKE